MTKMTWLEFVFLLCWGLGALAVTILVMSGLYVLFTGGFSQ